MIQQFLALAAIALLLGGCMYRMPTDDDICTVPLINNPQVTGDPGSSLLPMSGG